MVFIFLAGFASTFCRRSSSDKCKNYNRRCTLWVDIVDCLFLLIDVSKKNILLSSEIRTHTIFLRIYSDHRHSICIRVLFCICNFTAFAQLFIIWFGLINFPKLINYFALDSLAHMRSDLYENRININYVFCSLAQGLTFFLSYTILASVLGMLQFGFNTGVINAPEAVSDAIVLSKYV